jgi:D-amino-acid oxidase
VDTDIPGQKANARRWSSFILHAPKYIAHLSSELRKAGVPIIRHTVSSLDEAYQGSDLVINAMGLGARWFPGVEDVKVYAARGQTVLVKAPAWKKVCVMHTEGFNPPPGRKSFSCPKAWPLTQVETLPDPAYIIPRPGHDNHFILGGTYLVGNANTQADRKTGERILRECSALMQGFASTDAGVEVISHNVGLRPAREGGARIELERRAVGGRPVGLIHAYGFGSAGYVARSLYDLVIDSS